MQFTSINRVIFVVVLISIFYCQTLTQCLARNVSQYDKDPLLKQARLSFESHEIHRGERFLLQYVEKSRLQFPSGYTFGYEAAEVAAGNLDHKTAIKVIINLRDHYLLPSNLALRQGIDAALIKVYKRAKQWADGVKLVNKIAKEKKTNFILNITVLDFDRTLASLGKESEALQVSKQYFGIATNVTDSVVPTGFWMQKNADTALMLNEPSNCLKILNAIKKASPEYYRSNQVNIITIKAIALGRLSKYSAVAKQLSIAHALKEKGYPVAAQYRQLLEYKLKAYQRAGWLDKDFRAYPNQLFSVVPYPHNHSAQIIRIVILAIVLVPPFIIIFIAVKKRSSK